MSERYEAPWVERVRKRHPVRFWWEGFKMDVGYAWTWLTDGLVWDTTTFTDEDGCSMPRLMHARTKRHLPADDPRHWEET